ncbi:hypothetical protein B0H11DRAFT_1955719 [Mycena galericulata]|nr:hypothetical protein B0H11DRAFT_1955719 [Mycena galericulata]
MEGTTSTSADTLRQLPPRPSHSPPPSPSPPSSPASPSASSSSLSSLPSVSSSFFFSSAAASPPHVLHPQVHGEAEDLLVIPSLTLPPPLAPGTQTRTQERLKGKQKQKDIDQHNETQDRVRSPPRREPITRLLVLGPRDAAAAALLVPPSGADDDNIDGDSDNNSWPWVEEGGFFVLRGRYRYPGPHRATSTSTSNPGDSDSDLDLELISVSEDVNCVLFLPIFLLISTLLLLLRRGLPLYPPRRGLSRYPPRRGRALRLTSIR